MSFHLLSSSRTARRSTQTGFGRLEVQSTSAMESNVRAVAAILATK